MTLAFNTQIPSFTQFVVCMSQAAIVSEKNPMFLLFPIEKPSK